MSKPVKDEIFGTRKSRLRQALSFTALENVFFATCLRRINPDPATRYLLLQECMDEMSYQQGALQRIIPFVKPEITVGAVRFCGAEVQLRSLRHGTGRAGPPQELADFILKILRCSGGRRTPSTARIIDNAAVSPLSRFLRGKLYGRVSSTDIDFLIFSGDGRALTAVEEKSYTEKEGGSLGHGQYLSFREFIDDALEESALPRVRFFLLYPAPGQPDGCYLYDFLTERKQPLRQPLLYDQQRQEQRVLIGFQEMQLTCYADFLAGRILG